MFGHKSHSLDANLIITPSICIFSKENEICLEELHQTSADRSHEEKDGYRSFCFYVHNSGEQPYYAQSAYVKIDSGAKLAWAALTIQSNTQLLFHVYYSNMKLLAPGNHRVAFYMNDRLLSTAEFTLSNVADNSNVKSGSRSDGFSFPSQNQITAHNVSSKERAPYAACFYEFPESDYSGVAVDFKADAQPLYTYLCPIQWHMQVSTKKNGFHNKVKPSEGYAGVQSTEHGKIVIFSLWDSVLEDAGGRQRLVKAKLVYHKQTEEWLEIVDNGEEQGNNTSSFVSCRMSYDWRPGAWYRIIVKNGVHPTRGTTTTELWMIDLEKSVKECLIIYDLGIKDVSITSFSGFLECYAAETSGNVRDMELGNIRALHNKTGVWKSVVAVQSSIFNGVLKDLNGKGSYSYTSDGRILRVLTTGVPGHGSENGRKRFLITKCETGSPF